MNIAEYTHLPLNRPVAHTTSMSLRQIILLVLALLISASVQPGLAGWDGWSRPIGPLPPLFPEPPADEPLLVYSTNDVSATVIGITGSTSAAIEIPRAYHGLPVSAIGAFAFASSLVTSVTIPESVTRIDHGAFCNCVSLAGVYFQGSPPALGARVFSLCPAGIYYLPGTTGWGTALGGRETMHWSLPAPVILNPGSKRLRPCNLIGGSL